MALIICSKCGKQISDTVEKCIHCGNSIKAQHQASQGENKNNEKNLLDIIVEYKQKNVFYKFFSILSSVIIISLFLAFLLAEAYIFHSMLGQGHNTILIFLIIQHLILWICMLISTIKSNYVKKIMIFVGTKNKTYNYKQTVQLIKNAFDAEQLEILQMNDKYDENIVEFAWPIIFYANNKRNLIPHAILFIINVIYFICMAIMLFFAFKHFSELLVSQHIYRATILQDAFKLLLKWLLLTISKGIISKIILRIIKKEKEEILKKMVNEECK